jgi:hypothetical protein
MGWNKYADAAHCKKALYEEYIKLMRSGEGKEVLSRALMIALGEGKEVLSRALMIALQKTLDPHDPFFNHDKNEDMALMHLFINQYDYRDWRKEKDNDPT